MANYQVQAGVLFEDFESIVGWTVDAGSAASDATYFKTGSQSIKLTSTSGGAAYITKTISSDLSRAGRISLWVYLPSLAEVASVQIILASTTDFSKFFSYSTTALHEGWNLLTVGRDEWINTGGDAWENTMVKLRVRVNANTSQVAVAYFDSLNTQGFNRPKCIITFDDGFAENYTQGYTYMRQYGMKGTAYIVKNYLNTTGYMTTSQVQEMYDYGWDISNHTVDHTDLSTLDQSQGYSKLSDNQDYLFSQGWTRRACHRHVAFPFGGYNSGTLAALTSLNALTARPLINRTQGNDLDNNQLLTYRTIATATTLATAKSHIDRAIANGGVCILLFHKLVTSPSLTTEWGTANFQALIDYIQSKSSQIDVMTITEWYRGLTNARKLI
ncbi:MAG: polysaccharide deacetylase family protein [Acidobacteriota bacterium]|nr:polysaccharide deacetylase family protein [Acidobacteriota bacterium]